MCGGHAAGQEFGSVGVNAHHRQGYKGDRHDDYADTKGSDIIIITAGIARKPGMSRDDLLKTNADIVGKAAMETLKHSPNAILLC